MIKMSDMHLSYIHDSEWNTADLPRSLVSASRLPIIPRRIIVRTIMHRGRIVINSRSRLRIKITRARICQTVSLGDCRGSLSCDKQCTLTTLFTILTACCSRVLIRSGKSDEPADKRPKDKREEKSVVTENGRV